MTFALIPVLGLTDVWAALIAGQRVALDNALPLLLVVPVYFLFVALIGGGPDEALVLIAATRGRWVFGLRRRAS